MAKDNGSSLDAIRARHRASAEIYDKLSAKNADFQRREASLKADRTEFLLQHGTGDNGAASKLDQIDEQIRLLTRDQEAHALAFLRHQSAHQELSQELSAAEHEAAQAARLARKAEVQKQLEDCIRKYREDHLAVVRLRSKLVSLASAAFELGDHAAIERIGEEFNKVSSGYLLAVEGWQFAVPTLAISGRRDQICALVPPC